MSSLVTSGERSVAGKITRSGLDTRRSRPPASMIVASDGAMAPSSTTRRRPHADWTGSGLQSHRETDDPGQYQGRLARLQAPPLSGASHGTFDGQLSNG